MANFTKEQISFMRAVVLELSVSGKMSDILQLAQTAKDVLARLDKMEAEIDSPPQEVILDNKE